MQYQPYSNMKKLVKNGLTNLRIGQELAELGGYRWDLRNNSLQWSPKVYDIYDIDDVAQKPSLMTFHLIVW